MSHQRDFVIGACTACAACAFVASVYAWTRHGVSTTAGAPKTPPSSFDTLVGSTPLVRLGAVSLAAGAEIWAKLELRNPGGSNKDRVVCALVDEAEESGVLVRGEPGTLVEGSSGSTALSLAALAAARGYTCLVALPADAAADKVAALTRAGATVIVAPAVGFTNAEHYIHTARREAADLVARGERALFMDQFGAAGNAMAHEKGTGAELVEAIRRDGQGLAAFVCGAGTGGTFAGIGRALRAAGHTDVRMVLADPPGSVLAPFISAGVAFAPEQAERTIRRHRSDTIVEGIGTDRITPTLQIAAAMADAVARVEDDETVATSRFLLRREGYFVGSSSAVNVAAAVKVARALRAQGAPSSVRVITLLCDAGERHLAKFWNDDVITQWGLEAAAEYGQNDLKMTFVR